MNITGQKIGLNFYFSLFVGKLLNLVCRLFPFTGGTALPGLISLKLDPTLINQIREINRLESIIITGTNGKTTTSRLLAHMLMTNSVKLIQNRTGSNLLRGLASTLINQTNLSGKLDASLAIWELDEAAFEPALTQVRPSLVIFTNLFRDQLDRYGEIDSILKSWLSACQKLPPKTKILVNLDDPSLNFLAQKLKNKQQIFSYGLEQKSVRRHLAHASDAIFCPFCHQPLKFSRIFTSHLGHYLCSHCSFKRSSPDFKLEPELLPLFPLRGIHQRYNLLAALAAARILKIPEKSILQAIKTFKPAFGRQESFRFKQKPAHLFLVKNPAGFNVILETLKQTQQLNRPLLIAINDLIADGTDISWLWDVDLQVLNTRQQPVIVSGLRAEDLALRLKYAGLPKDLIQLQPHLKAALKDLGRSPAAPVYLLASYTAMLALRKILTQQKIIHSTWAD
jgi:UDP-N-acetylmuramyl tripeptide synthase